MDTIKIQIMFQSNIKYYSGDFMNNYLILPVTGREWSKVWVQM